MKRTAIAVKSLIICGLVTGGLYASGTPDLSKAIFVKIEKNVSKDFIGRIKRKAAQKGVTLVQNPKFGCKDASFGKKDIAAQGTMYGKNMPDGSLSVSGEGDFEAYSYIRYIKGKRECRETSYTKSYDPQRYGKESYAVILSR